MWDLPPVEVRSHACSRSPLRGLERHSLPFLDRAFDVIFVLAGDHKASVVHELLRMCNCCFQYPVDPVQPGIGNVLWPADDFAETHCQPSLFSENQQC